MPDLPPVVGIGASAGGLEALQEFVQAIPNDTGIAYVVVQHLAPDQPSLMDKLLSAHTPVPVSRIEDGSAIEPDHIYVIPPGPFLEIKDGRFRLIEHEREEGVRTPIDRLFTSLAQEAGRCAFAVVLSGTGSDGTMGVRAIKTQGGIALVQESRSARFPGMPDSAAATGLVDFVLRPQDIPGKILEIVRHREHIEEGIGRDRLLDEIEERLSEVVEQLGDEAGSTFSGYKPGTLVRQVARRMTLLRQSSVDGYMRTLQEKDAERQLLTQDFLIGVTQFFRDPAGFDTLRKKALKRLLDGEQTSFRIWVPGCSTGEEAYSIAILITELIEETGDRRSWKLFGTDIDLDALRHARTGRFSETSLKGLSSERTKRYFSEDSGFWQISPKLREMCVFAPHNLLRDPPFSKLDAISCRNVLIYLNAQSQQELFSRFHYALNRSGFLWLGPAESLGKSARFFRAIDQNERLFQRDDNATPGFSAISGGRNRPREFVGGRERRTTQTQTEVSREQRLEADAEQLYLQRRAAPFAVINRHNEVVYVSEAMTRLVKPSSGIVRTTIDEYLKQELRLPVHSVLGETRETGLDAEVRNVVVQYASGSRLFDVGATPYGSDSDLIMIALTEVRQRDFDQAIEEDTNGHDDSQGRELALTRRRLSVLQREFEGTEQELRNANEELISMNEELQSSNEELETSREELQSINEELETINSELTENNRQLSRSNSDLKNLLESTSIATLFIDQNDCVRLFTPELTRLFGVQDRDIGRPIHDLAAKVEYPELKADAEEVQRNLQTIEREVRIAATDETFVARLSPYRTMDNRLDGVVITFVDVTARKRNERQLEENATVLRQQYAELETLYDSTPIGLSLVDRQLRWLRINPTLAEINGFPVEAHIGKRQDELIPDVNDEIANEQEQVLQTGCASLGNVVRAETPAMPGINREFIVDYYPVHADEEIFALGCCVREVTKERELERQIVESEARLRRIFDEAPAYISIVEGPDHVFRYANPLHEEALGRRDLLGKPLREAIPELAGEDGFATYDTVFRTGQALETAELEARIDRGHGLERNVYRQVLQPWFAAQGSVGGVMTFAFDITEQVQAREEIHAGRNRLQKLQDSLNAFVGLLEADGTLREVNAKALESGGLQREEVIGKKFWDCWWWSFNEESQARLRQALSKAAAGETIRYDVPVRMADGEMIMIDFQLVPSVDDTGSVTEIIPSAVDISERVKAEERKDVLLAELEHRVKNTLATVQSIARFTARMSRSKEHMAESLNQRLEAIARTHDALTAQDWRGQNLRALVEAEVAAYADGAATRFSYHGDDLFLSPSTSLSLGLAFHELATNAAKYGAFSNDDGRVEVSVDATDDGVLRTIEWCEVGGPRVEAPKSEGFGSFLIGRLLERELDADIDIQYLETGLRCTITRKRKDPN